VLIDYVIAAALALVGLTGALVLTQEVIALHSAAYHLVIADNLLGEIEARLRDVESLVAGANGTLRRRNGISATILPLPRGRPAESTGISYRGARYKPDALELV
jgi:hypothetical protein